MKYSLRKVRRLSILLPLLRLTIPTMGVATIERWERAHPPSSTYTLCLKKGPTFKLSVTLSKLNRLSHFLHCRKAYEIFHKPM